MLTSNIALQNLVSSLADMNSRQTNIANEMSSGVRLSALSDDPVAAGQAATIADSLRRDDAFVATASSVGSRMQASDTALSSVVTQLTSAISTAVGAMSNSNGAAAQSTAATQLASIRSSLLSLANSSYSGSYLFSGSSATQPFTQAADGTVTYTGNADSSTVTTSSGTALQTSLPGSSIFTASGASVFGALNDVINALNSGTSPDAATQATLVGNLRDALSNVTSQRSVLNTAQNRLSSESDYATQQKTNLTAQQSTLLSADTATLATELSAVTTQRSALLSTIGIVQKGSLFDYL
jgi:flagellar hook-associated protein 3 FlgL